MTHREDVARSRDIFARWHALAERRLDHLTELFETGRWRRYHSEADFLENIREARTAVDIWRDLATREASRDNTAVDVSWLGRGAAASSRVVASQDRVHRLAPPQAPLPAEMLLSDVLTAAAAGQVAWEEAPSMPEVDAPDMEIAPEPVLDLTTIHERYPLLRNAL
jgi:uncharacterized repeat protein (TIGR03809 family)